MEELNKNFDELILTLEKMRDADKWGENKLFNEGQLAATYSLRGASYLRSNMFGKSIDDFDKGIEIWERMSSERKPFDENNFAMAYAGRGMAHLVESELELSIPDLNKSIEIWESLKNEGKDVDENMLNMVYSFIGNMDENTLAHNYMTKGNRSDQKEEFLEANLHYDKAIEIWERLHQKGIEIDNSEFAKAYMNRGANYYQTGKNDRALADYHKCISIIEQLQRDEIEQDTFDMVMAYKNRGMAYEIGGNMKAAINDNLTALRIIKKVFSDEPELQEIYYGTLIETIEMVVNNNDPELFKCILEEFLFSMCHIPKTEEAEEIQNSILEKLN